MITEIGIVSGEIRTLLEEADEPVTIRELELLLKENIGLIYMSLGWLAREGHIYIEEMREDYLVSRTPVNEYIRVHFMSNWKSNPERISRM